MGGAVMTFFDEVNQHQHKFLIRWVSQTFLQPNTARMLRKIKAAAVRDLLHESMTDCTALAECDEASFDRMWNRRVRRLENHMPFGHAAKLVDLYVLTAVNLQGLLSDKDAQKLRRLAHCPIDRWVLKKLFDEFPNKMKQLKGIRKNIALKKINRQQYFQLQRVLRERATKSHCVPLDFNFAYLRTN